MLADYGHAVEGREAKHPLLSCLSLEREFPRDYMTFGSTPSTSSTGTLAIGRQRRGPVGSRVRFCSKSYLCLGSKVSLATSLRTSEP